MKGEGEQKRTTTTTTMTATTTTTAIVMTTTTTAIAMTTTTAVECVTMLCCSDAHVRELPCAAQHSPLGTDEVRASQSEEHTHHGTARRPGGRFPHHGECVACCRCGSVRVISIYGAT